MSAEQIKTTFSPAMDEIIERCSVSEGYVDKEQFQILMLMQNLTKAYKKLIWKYLEMIN